MKYVICNPLNIEYRYQFARNRQTQHTAIFREAADPSLIRFQGKYYLFVSMSLSVFVSEDLVHWERHSLPRDLPLYDYAPDVRAIGGYVYFSASRRTENCDFYRTRDVLNGPYEKLEGTFPFWDPNIFEDEDGRLYFYWGCSNATPIYGTELDRQTLRPLGSPVELIHGDPWNRGYERTGEDHCQTPMSDEEADAALQEYLESLGDMADQVPPEMLPLIRGMFNRMPFIEGAWMTKYQGRYYLQYACPGTEYNIYADGVFVGDHPLGPFRLAENNPYSYRPGGFMPGAGHGSTLEDRHGNWWHTATMRISAQHPFERRVGLWPAGFDADGELFCNQRYGDWPLTVPEGKADPWREPEWMLLSCRKEATASSATEGHEPSKAADENAQTWWQARGTKDEWVQVDLGHSCQVNAVQINFADDAIETPLPADFYPLDEPRVIDERPMYTRWKLEGSGDGVTYELLCDKSEADTDLSNDLIVMERPAHIRYVRLTVKEVPYGQRPCVSGLRVFGRGSGEKPQIPEFTLTRETDMSFRVTIQTADTTGWNVLWGSSPEKLYHSRMTFDRECTVGALIKGRTYYVRVDAFNENGIIAGSCIKLTDSK